jgi:hypothetical protein
MKDNSTIRLESSSSHGMTSSVLAAREFKKLQFSTSGPTPHPSLTLARPTTSYSHTLDEFCKVIKLRAAVSEPASLPA